jgi:hypothetical protein
LDVHATHGRTRLFFSVGQVSIQVSGKAGAFFVVRLFSAFSTPFVLQNLRPDFGIDGRGCRIS